MSKATTTDNNIDDNDSGDRDGDNDYNIKTYSHMKRSRREEEESHFKIPKVWLHTLGALIVTNIVTVVVAGISLYVDVQLLKSRSVDQMRAINNLQDIVLYGRYPGSSKHHSGSNGSDDSNQD